MKTLKSFLKSMKKYRYRDAETGQMVTRVYALLHPKTTVREEIK